METPELILNPDILDFATRKHAGQVRKFSGEPYITHPIAVARIAKTIAPKGIDPRLLEAVALLHDTMEDTDTTYDDILSLFEDELFGIEVANCVSVLTKSLGETYLSAVLRAKDDPITRIVKLADNMHNSSDLKPGSQRDKYEMSMYILTH